MPAEGAATAVVGVTRILPVGLAAAAAAPSLEKDLATVAVVVDGWQLMLMPLGSVAQPPGVVAQVFAAAVVAAELLPVAAVCCCLLLLLFLLILLLLLLLLLKLLNLLAE